VAVFASRGPLACCRYNTAQSRAARAGMRRGLRHPGRRKRGARAGVVVGLAVGRVFRRFGGQRALLQADPVTRRERA
jgi:hypothetical protein